MSLKLFRKANSLVVSTTLHPNGAQTFVQTLRNLCLNPSANRVPSVVQKCRSSRARLPNPGDAEGFSTCNRVAGNIKNRYVKRENSQSLANELEKLGTEGEKSNLILAH